MSIRDYLSGLDYDESEQDAGQRSEIIPPQAPVSESLAPSRLDGYEPSQPPDNRIVESQFHDMTKKKKAKHTETTRAQNRKALDLDGSEQEAGQWSKMIPPQPSVAKLPAPARPDGYTHSQSPDDRIVESQSQDMMKKPKPKQKEPTLAQRTSVQSRMIPENLSFCVRIEPLSPDYGYHGQMIRHAEGGYWLPPNRTNGLTNGQGPTLLFRWKGGRISIVPANDPIQGMDLNRYMYDTATIFTQYPDTPHLLAVPFDARTRSVYHFGRGWQYIRFIHSRVGNINAYYSYISIRGVERAIAAPGSPRWMPELLPSQHDCDHRHSTRTQAGLIGDLPLLFALAAFSAPPESLETLLSSMQPGRWNPHGLRTGRN